MAVIKKKHKKLVIKPNQIKQNLWIFVNCLIENPAFDSQTKETLTTKQSMFGSSCVLSDKFLKAVANCGIVDSIVSFAEAKETAQLKKSLGTGKKK